MDRRFVTLDGLRGAAAMAVMLFHYTRWTWRPWVVPHGYLGVDFFFCLSGFVIAYAYAQKLEQMSWLRFMLTRAIRLWPTMAVGAMIAGAGYLETGASLVQVVEFIGLAMLTLPGPLTMSYWSLGYEIIANAIWARLPRAWILYPVLAAGCAGALLVLHRPLAFLGIATFWSGLARVGVSYCMGVLCCRLHMAGFNRLKAPPFLLAAGLVAVLFFPPFDPVCDVLCTVAVFPLIVLAGANAVAKSRVWKISGELSFPVYALHMPIWTGLWYAGWVAPHAPKWKIVAICALTAAVSWLVLKSYDEPVRRWLGGMLGKRPQLSRAAAGRP